MVRQGGGVVEWCGSDGGSGSDSNSSKGHVNLSLGGKKVVNILRECIVVVTVVVVMFVVIIV